MDKASLKKGHGNLGLQKSEQSCRSKARQSGWTSTVTRKNSGSRQQVEGSSWSGKDCRTNHFFPDVRREAEWAEGDRRHRKESLVPFTQKHRGKTNRPRSSRHTEGINKHHEWSQYRSIFKTLLEHQAQIAAWDSSSRRPFWGHHDTPRWQPINARFERTEASFPHIDSGCNATTNWQRHWRTIQIQTTPSVAPKSFRRPQQQ